MSDCWWQKRTPCGNKIQVLIMYFGTWYVDCQRSIPQGPWQTITCQKILKKVTHTCASRTTRWFRKEIFACNLAYSPHWVSSLNLMTGNFYINEIRLVRTVDPSWNGKWRTVPLPSKCLDLSRVRVYISGATLHYNKPYIRRRRLIARPFWLVSLSVDK